MYTITPKDLSMSRLSITAHTNDDNRRKCIIQICRPVIRLRIPQKGDRQKSPFVCKWFHSCVWISSIGWAHCRNITSSLSTHNMCILWLFHSSKYYEHDWLEDWYIGTAWTCIGKSINMCASAQSSCTTNSNYYVLKIVSGWLNSCRNTIHTSFGGTNSKLCVGVWRRTEDGTLVTAWYVYLYFHPLSNPFLVSYCFSTRSFTVPSHCW